MSSERTAQRTVATVERRPAAAVVHRSAAPPPASPARALQGRLGHGATQALIARSVASRSAASPAVTVAAPTSIQASKARRLPVSSPRDPAEVEAESVARHVMRMSAPAVAPVTPATHVPGAAHRSHAKPPAPAASNSASPVESTGAGSPLPSGVREKMEPRFGANFGAVRLHTGDAAAHQSSALDAHAFTIGQHIYFGRDKFQPHSATGQELIAHELTHTVQQGAAPRTGDVHRVAATVSHDVTPHVQRSWIPSAREWAADKAANIPGFTMLTVVMGFNPISGAKVERNAGNILRGAIQLIPGGTLITDALNAHGIFDRVSAWAAAQFETLKDVGARLVQDIEDFIKNFSITEAGSAWERAKALVMRPVDRVIGFAIGLKDGIVALVKDAILRPIAAFARTTNGYALLATVMGKDPITGEAVNQDADALLGGFMRFIGQEEIWATIQKAKAIPRAIAWFKGALKAVTAFVKEVPGLFVQAFKALRIEDIILIPRAFTKLAGVFGNFAARFITWGADAAWTLLEIVFDVVSPGALSYIKKTGAALKSILKNPLPFVGNLVKAAKLGFANFSAHFLDHLKTGLINWLTGALPGIYIPKAFSLAEIAKFAFSALGLTWANIRQKLVTATSETIVKSLETGFDIVVALVRDGPAAAWEKIKEQLSSLKDKVIGGITDFVVDMVVKKAIPKLIAMFIPGAGFITAIISIYDTIMVFVNKIKQIIQVVTGFIDSIVNIAAGSIGPAAERVEQTLAGALSLAINFLAGFAGLGNVADKLMAVLQRVREPIDKALDWLVTWIVNAAKSLYAKGKAAAGKLFSWAFSRVKFKDAKGSQHTLFVNDKGMLTIESQPQAALDFVKWYAKTEKLEASDTKPIEDLIAQAQVIANELAVASGDGKNAPLPARQRDLLDLNTKISAGISSLVGRKPLADAKKKYLLEGQVGTYASIPKPVGDQLTPDHQPQASVVQAAGDFFEEAKIDGGQLAERAKHRADKGYAINLHFKRHTAGATYGSKGETRDGFRKKLMAAAGKLGVTAAKTKVVEMLRAETKKDVERMKVVAAYGEKEKPWDNLDAEVGEAPAKELKKDIAARILEGENQIESQPFDF